MQYLSSKVSYYISKFRAMISMMEELPPPRHSTPGPHLAMRRGGSARFGFADYQSMVVLENSRRSTAAGAIFAALGLSRGASEVRQIGVRHLPVLRERAFASQPVLPRMPG